jgi:hypothetical protein
MLTDKEVPGWELLKHSEMIYEDGSYPSRIVMRKWGNEFVTHCRYYSDYGIGHAWGHYFRTREAAEEDYNARVKRGY